MDGFQRRAKRKQHSILAAAENFIITHGLRGTTIQMIAKAADVSQVSIYNYFEHKDRVIYEVMKRLLENQTKTFESIVYDASKTFDKKLDELLVFTNNALDDLHEDVIAYLFNRNHKAMRELLDWYTTNRIMMGMDHLIREGKKEGVVLNKISESSIMAFLGLYKALDFSTYHYHKTTLKDLVHMFFYGIRGQS